MRFLSLLLFSILLSAQPQFDVASIRDTGIQPGTEGSGREQVELTPNSVWLRNASLSFVIQWAYDVRFYQVSGAEWLKDQRWDILAKTQAVHSEKEFREMMRGLLADRFNLVSHTERRARPVYTLIARKVGNKLQKSAMESSGAFQVIGGDFVFTNTTMAEFADRLSDFSTVDRPVLDRTGLTGRYTFKLDSVARAIRGGEGPSIFTAVSEIGLQMKPESEPLDVIVVDSAAKKPTEN